MNPLKQAIDTTGNVSGFTCYSADTAESVLSTAEWRRRPVALLVSEAAFRLPGGVRLIAALNGMIRASGALAFVQADHIHDLETAAAALRAGVGAVMIDGSALGFDANVELTAAVVRLAQSHGAGVEGELGQVGGDEEDSRAGVSSRSGTDPRRAGEFVSRTGVDVLAVAVGNSHGRYATAPRLDWDRLDDILAETDVPLALHGASGLSRADVARAGQSGIAKVNYNTELRETWFDAVSRELPLAREGARQLELLVAVGAAVSSVVAEKLDILASTQGRSQPMEQRLLGRTGRQVGVVGLGTWQLGADWGDVTDESALDVLAAAVAAGTTFIDTADVYGDGRSERLVGAFLREHPDAGLTVATKMGQRVEQDPAMFTLDAFRSWTDRSRANLGVDALDLIQLHCQPSEILEMDSVFDDLDQLVAEGRVRAYGVSVETCRQALLCIVRPRVATIQIILNPLRRKPLREVLPAAVAAGVGIIVRVPLASGLLSGRYTAQTTFPADDHRTYNRDGSAFDVGETFAGVPFETGVDVAGRMASELSPGVPLAAAALRWSIDRPGVSVVIPGARSPEQARANAAAAAMAPLSAETEHAWERIYAEDVQPVLRDRW